MDNQSVSPFTKMSSQQIEDLFQTSDAYEEALRQCSVGEAFEVLLGSHNPSSLRSRLDKAAERVLGVRLRFAFGNNATGEPCLHFLVTNIPAGQSLRLRKTYIPSNNEVIRRRNTKAHVDP